MIMNALCIGHERLGKGSTRLSFERNSWIPHVFIHSLSVSDVREEALDEAYFTSGNIHVSIKKGHKKNRQTSITSNH
jgi:hypothetical protein